jgi:hypothetical protein
MFIPKNSRNSFENSSLITTGGTTPSLFSGTALTVIFTAQA